MKKEENKKPKKEVIAKLKGELEAIKDEIKSDVTGPVVASFGFIIALVWRDAIRSLIDEFLINVGWFSKPYMYDIFSAVIVTIAVIFIMVTVTRMGRKRKRKKLEKKIKEKFKSNNQEKKK